MATAPANSDQGAPQSIQDLQTTPRASVDAQRCQLEAACHSVLPPSPAEDSVSSSTPAELSDNADPQPAPAPSKKPEMRLKEYAISKRRPEYQVAAFKTTLGKEEQKDEGQERGKAGPSKIDHDRTPTTSILAPRSGPNSNETAKADPRSPSESSSSEPEKPKFYRLGSTKARKSKGDESQGTSNSGSPPSMVQGARDMLKAFAAGNKKDKQRAREEEVPPKRRKSDFEDREAQRPGESVQDWQKRRDFQPDYVHIEYAEEEESEAAVADDEMDGPPQAPSTWRRAWWTLYGMGKVPSRGSSSGGEEDSSGQENKNQK